MGPCTARHRSLHGEGAVIPQRCQAQPVPASGAGHPSLSASIHPSVPPGWSTGHPPAVTSPGGTRGTPGRSQPCRLWAQGEQLGWVQRGRHWVCWHPARGCGHPPRTPRMPRVGLGWHLPFPAGPRPAGAAPSPHYWQGAARPPALGDESWSFRGAGEEPGPGSSPPSP